MVNALCQKQCHNALLLGHVQLFERSIFTGVLAATHNPAWNLFCIAALINGECSLPETVSQCIAYRPCTAV